MKGFKIPSAQEIADKRRSGSKRKVGDTSAIDHSTGSAVAVIFGLAKSSPNMTSSQKRPRVEEGDDLVV